MSLDGNRGRGKASRRPMMSAREYRNSFVRTEDRDARHRDPPMPSRRPMMSAREYRNSFVIRTEDRAGDRDLMNQHGDPRRPVAASDAHRGTDIVQVPSDDDEILEYTPSTPEYSPIGEDYTPTSPEYSPIGEDYTPSTPKYSPTVADYTPSTPSEDSTARFCPGDHSRSRH